MLRARSLLLACSIMAVGALHAQTFFEHVSKADGLPGDQVLALHEDQNGFIWIGTESGLARHEGVRIRTWYHDRKDPRSLPNDQVWDIAADERGSIWVATDHGLGRYDARTGSFDRVFITRAHNDPTSANRVHRIVADGEGLLWLSTEDGVHVVSTIGTWQQVALPGNGKDLQPITARLRLHGLQNDTIRNGLWINTNQGVLFYDRDTHTFKPGSSDPAFACLNDSLAQDVLPDGNGGVWYFTRGSKELVHADRQGVVRSRETITTSTAQLVNPQFIRTDHLGGLWLSTWSHELRRRDAVSGMWQQIAHDDAIPWSITSSNTKSWLQDRSGRIWLGTYLGLNVIDPAHEGLRPLVIGSAVNPSDIETIAPLGDERLLVGAMDGMTLLDRSLGDQVRLWYNEARSDTAFLPYVNRLRCAMPYDDGWLLGTHDGLLTLNKDQRTLARPQHLVNKDQRMVQGTISFIEQDVTGNTWIGKMKGGLYRLDRQGELVAFDSVAREPLGTRRVLACATGPEGTWFGLNNGHGLCLVRNDSILIRALNTPDPTGTNYGVVLSLARGNDGTLYVGTLMGGLGVREPHSGFFTWYTRSDGLTGDRVERLLLDNDNGLWILTLDGICRFDTRTHAIDRLDIPTSIRSMGTLMTMALDTDGSLLCAFGPVLLDVTLQGQQQREGPDVVLTGLRHGGMSNTSWPTDSIVELAHDARSLSIEYGALNFFSDQATRFSYRVADMDSTWNNLGSATRLDLNDLPPGTHLIEVRANSGGTSWTARPLAVTVHVLPPIWDTWWFRIAVVLLAIALAWFGVRSYVRERLREQRERMEREQAILSERVRIAGDMHDDLGAGLSALKLKSEMALRVEKDPAKREQLGALANTAGELIGSMRQIIWTMNGDQASVEDLVVYATSYARNYCEQNGLVIEVKADGPWPAVQLSTEQRRNVFLVVKEALHNVVKHAHAKHVTIRMDWHDGLVVELTDDGVGLARGAERGQGNGLRNMEKRISAVGGSLTLAGGTEGGTRIRFQVTFAPTPNQGSIAAALER